MVLAKSDSVRLIRDIYADRQSVDRPVISFEFFTPKTSKGDKVLCESTLPALIRLRPDYCSVTYGAGGSTKSKTLSLVNMIQRQFGLTTMAHLTCVESSKNDIGVVLNDAKELGIRNILALRGDPPGGSGEFIKADDGFEYSYELVRFIKANGDFCVGTAGFPEGHIACTEGKHVDWGYLKNKVDCGADFVLTQLFFNNADFLQFRDYIVKKLGVTVPICPGVLPILSSKQISKFTELCGAGIPKALAARLESLGDDDEATTAFGIEYATKQCEELIREGVVGLHMYSLNKVHSTSEIIKNLGLS